MKGKFFINTYLVCLVLSVIVSLCQWFEIFSLPITLWALNQTFCLLSPLLFPIFMSLVSKDFGKRKIFHPFWMLCLIIAGVFTIYFSTHIVIDKCQNGKYALVKKAFFLHKEILSDCDSIVGHKVAAQAWRYNYIKVAHMDWVEMYAFRRNKHEWGLYFPDNENRCVDKRLIFPAVYDSIVLSERIIIQSHDTIRYSVFKLWLGGKSCERNYHGKIPTDEIEIRVDLTPDSVP